MWLLIQLVQGLPSIKRANALFITPLSLPEENVRSGASIKISVLICHLWWCSCGGQVAEFAVAQWLGLSLQTGGRVNLNSSVSAGLTHWFDTQSSRKWMRTNKSWILKLFYLMVHDMMIVICDSVPVWQYHGYCLYRH